MHSTGNSGGKGGVIEITGIQQRPPGHSLSFEESDLYFN